MSEIFKPEYGFSAAELLVAIFIAAAFTTTGYQLYSAVILNSADARTRAIAYNIAYENVRFQSAYAPGSCAYSTSTQAIASNRNLPPPSSVTVTFSCAATAVDAGSTAVSKVQATVIYGTPQKEVVSAIYITR